MSQNRAIRACAAVRPSSRLWVALLGAVGCLAATAIALPVLAHDAHHHSKAKTNAAPPAAALPNPDGQFLGGKIGGDFDLTDQLGQRRRLVDFAGRHVLLFFGYAQCESICSAAIPLMSDTLDQLGEKGAAIDLVMITVDPDRDTPEGLRSGMRKYDPRFIGLTGTQEALEPVWKAFQISTKEVSRDPQGQPIFAHGSFIYLLGPQGEVKTLIPPILSPKQMGLIVGKYIP